MKCGEWYGMSHSGDTRGRRWLAAVMVLVAGALAVGCGGDDRGLHNELQAFPPSAGTLPAGYSVAATESLDLGQPLQNNRGATYVLTSEGTELADVRISVVVFTHRDAVHSYVAEQRQADELGGIFDDELEHDGTFIPSGRDDALCTEGEHDSGARERVCVVAAGRTLVASELSADGGVDLPEVSFDVSLLEAGSDHALGLLANE